MASSRTPCHCPRLDSMIQEEQHRALLHSDLDSECHLDSDLESGFVLGSRLLTLLLHHPDSDLEALLEELYKEVPWQLLALLQAW